jgi:cysteine desulfurase/selenocysteine lyase
MDLHRATIDLSDPLAEAAQSVRRPIERPRDLFVGIERETPLLDGGSRTYVNLDNAATTPALREVVEAVNHFVEWQSSVHRGAGFKSHLSTEIYERCRRIVGEFFGADPDYHAVLFCANTTEAVNRLASTFQFDETQTVLTTIMEHHSNMLPWRGRNKVRYVPILNGSDRLDLGSLERELRERRGSVPLVSVTGASNVTGAIPPIREIARVAHEHGAYFLVDAAQLAAHRPIDMGSGDDPGRIDFLAFSGHKMYAPFGSGALIGPREFFESRPPCVVGGGAVETVTLDQVEWASVPDKGEAGTPNVLGAVAIAKAIRVLQGLGLRNVADHERKLTAAALARLSRIDGIELRGQGHEGPGRDRVGVIPLTAPKVPHALLASILSYEWGIGVRHGCFCAHPYVIKLLGLNEEEVRRHILKVQDGDLSQRPGFVRVSLGLYNTEKEIEYLAEALEQILTDGPRGRYEVDKATGEYRPVGFTYDVDSCFSI